MALPCGVPQPPERVPPASKTATIRGKTTNAKTGSPVKDVRVTLGLSGHGELAGSATSDTNGGYEIPAAPRPCNTIKDRDGLFFSPLLCVGHPAPPQVRDRAGKGGRFTRLPLGP